jgi:acylphosphatase
MVMYRDFAQRKAKRLGVVGTVENLEDGTVRVIAEGEEESLLVFMEHLKEGSTFSKVKNVSVEWIPIFGLFIKIFSIEFK